MSDMETGGEFYEDGEREEFPPDEFEAEEEPGEAAPTGEVNSDDEENSASKKVKRAGAAKRIVRNPQVKLDDMKLCGQRGLPLLPKTFRDVKFKGKGHERKDLDLYLSKMEHWGHRMFPKMVFDEVIERCDRLYKTKKLVKTTLIHMRNGDNLLDEDIEREGGAKDDDDDDAVDDDFPDDVAILSSTVQLNDDAIPAASLTPSIRPVADPTPVVISDDVKERIERNKRLAMEKRLARLKALEESTAESPTPVAAPVAAHQLPPVVTRDTAPGTGVTESPVSGVTEVLGPEPTGMDDVSSDSAIAKKCDPSTPTHNELDEEELLRLINA